MTTCKEYSIAASKSINAEKKQDVICKVLLDLLTTRPGIKIQVFSKNSMASQQLMQNMKKTIELRSGQTDEAETATMHSTLAELARALGDSSFAEQLQQPRDGKTL